MLSCAKEMILTKREAGVEELDSITLSVVVSTREEKRMVTYKVLVSGGRACSIGERSGECTDHRSKFGARA